MNGSTRRTLFILAAGATIGLFAGAGLAQTSAAPQPNKPVSAQPATKPEIKATATTVAKVGEAAPEFTLKDTDGKEVNLADLTKAGKVVVLEWFNPDCPVSGGYHTQSTVMVDTAKEFKDKGVVWLAINSTGKDKGGDGVDRNAKARKDWGIEYPVLLDEAGTVGRAYGAKTTPHMYIIGADGKLAYKGDIVDQQNPDTNYVKQALTQILAKETVTTPETKSNGCPVHYGPEPKKTN